MARKYRYRVAGGCALCMTCLYQCPVQAISLIPDVSAVIDQDKCIKCGMCIATCKFKAIIKK